MYLALTGELPFSGNTNEAILIAKEKGKPPAIDRKKLKGPLSKNAEKALMKALSRQPEDRFDTCMEFAEAFADEGERAGLTLPLRPVAIAAVALLALAAAFGLDWSRLLSSPGREATATPIAGAEAPPEAITVQLGSTPEEIDRAVFLCERGGGSESACAREGLLRRAAPDRHPRPPSSSTRPR